MTNISKLTSGKTKIIYVVLYSLYMAVYTANPLFIMWFIDAVEAENVNGMILYAALYFASFLLIQIGGYILAVYVGKIEKENFINYFTKISDIAALRDIRKNDIDPSELSQYMGQYYEDANWWFFLKKVDITFSVISIAAIFTIMFIIEWRIAAILLVVVPLSFFVSKKFGDKLYKNSDKNVTNSDRIKKYVIDENALTKEERFATHKQLIGILPLLGVYGNDYMKSVKTKSIYLYFFTYAFLNFAILLVILLSGYFTYINILTIGTLFAYQNYTSQLWSPGESLMSFSGDRQEIKPILAKIEKLLSFETAKYADENIEEIELKDYSALNAEGNPLFEKINLIFKKGKTYLIEGDNGAGKTTLTESILGFNSRYLGKILINGKEESSNDIVYIPATAYISEFFSETLAKGSSGQKKLAQIELYLKTEKTVYILDEPTNFVDEANREKIYSRVNELQDGNKIVIIISHDKNFENIAADTIFLGSSTAIQSAQN